MIKNNDTLRGTVYNVAVEMVKENGLINLSRKELAKRAGIKETSFTYVMGESFTDFVAHRLKNIESEFNGHVVKTRTFPLLRKDHILNVAVELSKQPGGFTGLTRQMVAETAGVSSGLINNYYGTMVQLKRDVMRTAIRERVLEIIGQGVACGDKHANKAPKGLKQQAINYLA